MQDIHSHENENVEQELSLEKAEEILRNVYRAVGTAPPDNCAEILRRNTQKSFQMKDT